MGIVWLAACVLIAGSLAAREDASQVREDSPIAVERIEKHLGLRAPYRIVQLGMYVDGGSIGGTIADARGKQVLFAWDGRERVGLLNGDRPYLDSDPRLAYIGALYPGKGGSRPLAVGSPEESALVDVLRLAVITGQDSLPPSWIDSAKRVATFLSVQRLPRVYRVR